MVKISIVRGCSSAGRAPAWHAGGQGFKSPVIFINTSTRFTDGEMFGFGAEVGISTQKLHVRGPMGLEALTSERYVVTTEGMARE